MNIIQVYQTNPFQDGQGGGIRYLQNLLFGIKPRCRKILFFGIGQRRIQKSNITLIPITEKQTGYVWFLTCLCFKLLFKSLSGFHIVHVHRAYFAIPFILLKPHLKVVCTLHGRTFSVFKDRYGIGLYKSLEMVFKLIETAALRRCDYLVPVSQDVWDDFLGKYPWLCTYKNVTHIGSMIDLEKFRVRESTYLQERFGAENQYVLFIGRLAAVKDLDFLFNLWCAEFGERHRVKLAVVGRGEQKQEQEIKALAEKKCKINKPIFVGAVAPEEVPYIISSASMLILCSKHEASPTVVKEALACGVPVVTNKVGDVEKFISQGKNGYIVDKTEQDYLKAINSLLEKPPNKASVRDCSIEKIMPFSLQKVPEKYLEIYSRLGPR